MKTSGSKKTKPGKPRKKISVPKTRKKTTASKSVKRQVSSGKKSTGSRQTTKVKQERKKRASTITGSRESSNDLKKFKFISDNSNDAYFLVDHRAQFCYVNKAACSMLGYSEDELLKLGVPDVDIVYDKIKYQELFDLTQKKKVPSFETTNMRKNGSSFPSEITATGYKINGKLYMFAALRDITLRKQAEQILLKEKKFFETAINCLPGVFYIFEHSGKFLRWNKNFEKITGYSGKEISKMTPLDFFDKEEKKIVADKIQEVFVKGESSVKADIVLKNGEKLPFYFTGLRLKIGDKTCLIGTGIDISEHRKAEEQILLSRQEWEEIFNNITDMITVHDKDFNIIRANSAAEQVLGLSLLKDKPLKCFEYYHGKNKPPENCLSCTCIKTGKPAVFEAFEPHLNMFVETRAMPKFDVNNNMVGLIRVTRDITDRKKIESEHGKLLDVVTKAKIEWEKTFDSVTELIILIDKEFNIIRCNKSFSDFTGLAISELIGKKCHEFFAPEPEQFAHCKDFMLRGEPITRAEMNIKDNYWFYINSQPIKDKKGDFKHTVIIATDITDMKDTQQKLIKSEKELMKRLQELEKFYNMAIGREVKMKELKKKIKELQLELSGNGG